ncbi:NAD-dependent epimerase/dehydratase family protein [Bradyrhizobium sp. DASA03120]|uniref:NAD-dependent epimerase/dehydratase family protein n=1 Tax=Bradyrhizobium sp. SMVTL-02 TaxID=3395917 RepID=UPI003F6F208A
MKDGSPVVLVTGASGFVGRNLVPLLEREGWIVRRVVRRSSSSEDEVVVGSIGPTTIWEPALIGVDAVVHLAARVHHPNEEHAAELYKSVNTEGTLQLARAAAHAGVRTFVFLSTILVNGGCTDGRAAFNENDAIHPRGVYGLSKANAEVGLNSLAERSRMRIAIVRPPLVYGADAVGNFRHLVKAVRLGVPLPLASIRNRRAFISVQNLTSFILRLLHCEGNGSQAYLVADSEQISTPEFVTLIGEAMNKRASLLPVPMNLLELALRMTKPELRDSLVGSMEIDVSRAVSTGWRPLLTMEEGLKLAVNSRSNF